MRICIWRINSFVLYLYGRKFTLANKNLRFVFKMEGEDVYDYWSMGQAFPKF